MRFEGWSIHLPLRVEGRYAEAEALTRAAVAVIPGTLWLSHLPPDEASRLGRGAAGAEPVAVRLRVGTRLWLGDETHRQTVATVLDVHPVRRGERAGYRGAAGARRRLDRGGGRRHRARHRDGGPDVRGHPAAAGGLGGDGSLEAAGLALSPYTINGKKRWFLEPPHMQSSQLFLPRQETPPAIGDEVPVELRLTTATVDRVDWDL